MADSALGALRSDGSDYFFGAGFFFAAGLAAEGFLAAGFAAFFA
ncbi:MAG: hypothetical protein RL340_1472, partial [Gemmatimonadota bacterium]